jgi:hypothetical protein
VASHRSRGNNPHHETNQQIEIHPLHQQQIWQNNSGEKSDVQQKHMENLAGTEDICITTKKANRSIVDDSNVFDGNGAVSEAFYSDTVDWSLEELNRQNQIQIYNEVQRQHDSTFNRNEFYQDGKRQKQLSTRPVDSRIIAELQPPHTVKKSNSAEDDGDRLLLQQLSQVKGILLCYC